MVDNEDVEERGGGRGGNSAGPGSVALEGGERGAECRLIPS